MIPVFDSNIVIDFLNGSHQALEEIEAYDERAISLLVWIEVMAGIHDTTKRAAVDDYLKREFLIYPMNEDVALQAAALRRESKLKLPDALILATALCHHTLLVTRNHKDFSAYSDHIRVPYHLKT